MTIAYEQHNLTTPGGKLARFYLRNGTNDFNVAASVTLWDEYGLRGRSFTGWALDLGCHCGAVAVSLALDNPGLRVVAVEPIPDNVELTRRNAALNEVADQVEVIQAAVGPPFGTTKIRYRFRGDENSEHHAWVGNTSLVYRQPPVQEHDELEVPFVDLLELKAGYFLGEAPSFLKVDCEGGEWDAIDQLVHLGAGFVSGEWHPVLGRTSSEELEQAFTRAGYVVTTDGPEGGPGLFTATR